MNSMKYAPVMKKPMLSIMSALLIAAAPVSAKNTDWSGTSTDGLREILDVEVRTIQHMALNPVVVHAVRHQNEKKLKAAMIKTRDAEWKKSSANHSFKLSLQGNEAGMFLKQKVGASTSFSKAFLTDNQGATVATYPVSDAYNQSDTESWSASWDSGRGVIFIEKPEIDRSTGLQSVKVSAPVKDRGKTIGVLVVGITNSITEDKTK